MDKTGSRKRRGRGDAFVSGEIIITIKKHKTRERKFKTQTKEKY